VCLALVAIFAVVSAFAGPHGPSTTGGVTLEAWQVINLIGAPLLALLFLRPVLDDLSAWWRSIRGQP
jgi:hypothetical protein